MADITGLLQRWRDGDAQALDELTPLVYDELHQLAAPYMRRERPGHTLQPTALVHEAFMRLAGLRRANFENRLHFYGAAAQVMRRILVDHSRRRGAAKRGRDHLTLPLNEATPLGIDTRLDLVALDDALKQLTIVAERPARVVELRFFGGLTVEETALVLGIAPATVKRHWAFARAWLLRELSAA
ncbi:MAG TPA: sigma-70 family RNA polymerase sigma factor [Vicinamibacterales bacterium]|nr:sigma-70 family RNA polymerase sigma factor [Vicinamibacterales bacterium]